MGSSNPFKSVTKAVKKAAGQVSAETGRAGDTLSKVGSAVAGAAQDPGAWMGFLASPIAGQAIGSQAAIDNYQALSQAEKDEARAEAERRMALSEEQRLLEDQKAAQAEQAKMVRDRDAKATASAEERAKRLGTGRRGLLYQGGSGTETGVKSKVLGG